MRKMLSFSLSVFSHLKDGFTAIRMCKLQLNPFDSIVYETIASGLISLAEIFSLKIPLSVVKTRR